MGTTWILESYQDQNPDSITYQLCNLGKVTFPEPSLSN